ncbi:histidinol dehydrogenase [Sphingosinicella sp. BN140058]|uniref:histidinol dehydrogenase n=1 Tax=Sphingosinicella sp. BN140058 TaxID=1892855 RepID=UPI001011B126|nr:histidinol dehydrogenase [Sphingosinicella sp. BN140058]QAY78253.1 histidinol dehydrogenase [Sphingosinicella sp. BN140058]
MKTYNWTDLNAAARRIALARPEQRSDPALQVAVRAIVDDVRSRGWEALVQQATRLDGEAPTRVAVAPIAAEARRTLSADQIEAIELAARNIETFHAGSLPQDHVVETLPGLTVRKIWRAIDRVGLYIPGGKTPLFSTLLMLAIPARAAGVAEIVVATPPRPGGGLDPVIALAAELCEIDAIWTVGGAQAIAALAFGAGDIPAAAKICGPGNAWVAEAKNYVASLPGGAAIDMPAGPSELMVIADDSADPTTVAADLLSQAEHDPTAQVLLATPSKALADAVEREVSAQAATLPRAEIAEASLAHARFVITADLKDAAEVANLYAPEHLSLAVAQPEDLLGGIRNAGAIFAGRLASETFGDYLAGSSHVLPTDGAARAWSGVSAYTFLKAISVQTVTAEAAVRIAGPAAALARLEGLEAHARSADARLAVAAGSNAAPPPFPSPSGRGVKEVAEALARPEILALPPFDIAAQANEAFGPDAIKLDANENPFAPLSEGALAAGLNRYPEPQPARLKKAMAALYGVAPDNLIVTRGADDAIDILIRAFCRPALDAVSICTPTFSAYGHFAKLQGARLIEAKLDANFDFDADAFLDTVRHEPSLKLAFICAPNNPTGNLVDPADVLRVADALPNTLIVLDEAYLEFSETPSLAEEAIRRPNLAILKTLSKAFGLAGARIGALLGNPDLIAIAARALPPYPLPSLSIEAALAALSPSRRPIHLERIARIKADRDRLAGEFARAPIVNAVRSGGGNFLFLEVDDPAALAKKLNGLGIRARFRPNAAPGGVRITIGTDAENDAALAAFGVPANDSPARRGEVVRDTKETKIAVAVDLDRPAPRKIDTGIPFYDHMLDQIAAHAGFSLILSCEGDLEIDAHHSVEDCAIAFGTALSRALADRRGIGRFGFSLPMDETEAHVLIDLSGRPYSVFEGTFEASHIGDYPTEMTRHVFRSLADSLGAAIHVRVQGENDHHKTEACFKAFGRALRQAVGREGDRDAMPSTKGVL